VHVQGRKEQRTHEGTGARALAPLPLVPT